VNIILFAIGSFSLLAGMALLYFSRGAIHEVGAFVFLLIAAVFWSGAAIVSAINSLHSVIKLALGVTEDK
jgi:hypothetical protein